MSRHVSVKFPGGSAKTYTYRVADTCKSKIKKQDLAVVKVSSELKVVTIVEVMEDYQESRSIDYKTIVGVVTQ